MQDALRRLSEVMLQSLVSKFLVEAVPAPGEMRSNSTQDYVGYLDGGSGEALRKHPMDLPFASTGDTGRARGWSRTGLVEGNGWHLL
jgi:hypothetical protein